VVGVDDEGGGGAGTSLGVSKVFFYYCCLGAGTED